MQSKDFTISTGEQADYSVGVSPPSFTQQWNPRRYDDITGGIEIYQGEDTWQTSGSYIITYPPRETQFYQEEDTWQRSELIRLLCHFLVETIPRQGVVELLEMLNDIYKFYLTSYDSETDPSLNEGSTIFRTFWTNRKGQQEYDVIISRLINLFQEEQDEGEEDEYGALFPTRYAQDRALSLITQTYHLVGNLFTRAAVTTSFEGGLRIQWIRPHASVRLVIAANEGGQEYIYFEAGDEYDTEDVSPHNLANRLVWLQRSATHA